MITADFTDTRASNLVWRTKGDLVELIADKKFQTPENFFEDSITVSINGQSLNIDADNGFVVLDDETFELKEAFSEPFFLLVGYLRK